MDVSGKLAYWDWLIFTQVFGLFSSRTDKHRAEELADLISVCIGYIEKMEMDPAKVFQARSKKKAKSLPSIFASYRKYWDGARQEEQP